MWRRVKLLGIALAFGVLASATASWETDYELGSLEGFELVGKLPSLEGKVTLIDFWASWCEPCKKSFPEMEHLYRQYSDKGFQVVAVNLDRNARSMQRFLDKQELSFATVRDEKERLVKSAGITVMPSSFLIDRNGKVRFSLEGWHGKKTEELLTEYIELLLSE